MSDVTSEDRHDPNPLDGSWIEFLCGLGRASSHAQTAPELRPKARPSDICSDTAPVFAPSLRPEGLRQLSPVSRSLDSEMPVAQTIPVCDRNAPRVSNTPPRNRVPLPKAANQNVGVVQLFFQEQRGTDGRLRRRVRPVARGASAAGSVAPPRGRVASAAATLHFVSKRR